MGAPERIQLRRTKGWRKPEETVVVARPSRWGNPFRIVRVECTAPAGGLCWTVTDGRRLTKEHLGDQDVHEMAVEMFRLHTGPMGDYEYDDATLTRLRRELGGRDLACWCPLDRPCHADVLLELANTAAPVEA